MKGFIRIVLHLPRSRFAAARGKALLFAATALLLVVVAVGAPAQSTGAGYQYPPDIQPIMQKLKDRQPLTPEETQKLRDWAKSVQPKQSSTQGVSGGSKEGKSGSAGGAHAKQGHERFYCVVGSKPQSLQPPTAAQYRALVTAIRKTYADQSPQAKGWVDAALVGQTRRSPMANFGPVLVIMSRGQAGVYALATAALRFPGDAAIAANLGVALHMVGDDKNSLPILLYANAAAPRVPTTLTSLGWTLYALLDTADARKFFSEAVDLAPRLGMAELGLGVSMQCSGQHIEAIAHLRRSLGGGGAILMTDQALQDAESEAQAALKQQSASNAPPAVGSISDLLPDPPPNASSCANFPDLQPQDTQDAAVQVQSYYGAMNNANHIALQNYTGSVLMPYLHSRKMVVTPASVTMYLNPEGYIDAAHDIVGYYSPMYSQDAAEILTPAVKAGSAAFTRDITNSQNYCADIRRAYADRFSAFAPAFINSWKADKSYLSQFCNREFQLMSKIGDTTARKDVYLLTQYSVSDRYATDSLSPGANPRLPPGSQSCPEPPAGSSPNPKPPSPTEPEGKCGIPGALKIDFGLVSTKFSCEEVEFELSSGLIPESPFKFTGSVAYQFEKGSATAFFGIDTSLESEGVPLSGKTGIYVSVDSLGTQGEITDVGVLSELNMLGAKFTGQISLEGGPTGVVPTPEVTLSNPE